MEIGDGLSTSEETRLTRFIGNISPNNVTSISNSAWIYIESPPGNISMISEMTIVSVNISGKSHPLKSIYHSTAFMGKHRNALYVNDIL